MREGAPDPIRSPFRYQRPIDLDLLDVSGLRPLLPLNDLELDLVPFSERLEARAVDRAEVHEHIGTTLARDEAEALRVVEPLHGAGDASHDAFHSFLYQRASVILAPPEPLRE